MLADKLKAAVVAHRMFAPGDLVVVGVSGGPDSVALLHALSGLSGALGVRLHVAHLNHMLRGAAADADAAYVSRLSEQLGWPVTVAASDVAALRRERRWTLEEAARVARYAFFAEVVNGCGAVGVVVGHTAADQVETVVMHWLRGAGSRGLRGMRPAHELRLRDLAGPLVPSFPCEHASTAPSFPCEHASTAPSFPRKRESTAPPLPCERESTAHELPLRDPTGTSASALRVLRPLLDVSREEVDAYCREHALQPRVDATNRDLHLLRNRIRHELLPRLTALNPRFAEAVLRAARIAAADDDYLTAQAAALWPEVALERDGYLAFALEKWHNLARSLQHYLLRAGFARLRGDLLELSAAHLASAIEAIERKPAGTVVTWPRGVRLVKRYADFRLSCGAQPRPSPSPEGEPLLVPGDTMVAGGRWLVRAKLAPRRCPPTEDAPWHADLDLAATGTLLAVRPRRPGDRFQPLGMASTKKLQDFLVDAKVPREERDDVPVVVAGARIAWLPGLRIADWAKVTPESKTVLCIRFES